MFFHIVQNQKGGMRIYWKDSNAKIALTAPSNQWSTSSLLPTLDYNYSPMVLVLKEINDTIPYLCHWLATHMFESCCDIGQYLPNHRKGKCLLH